MTNVTRVQGTDFIINLHRIKDDNLNTVFLFTSVGFVLFTYCYTVHVYHLTQLKLEKEASKPTGKNRYSSFHMKDNCG